MEGVEHMECYTPDEVAKILKISKSQAYNLFNSSLQETQFNSFKIGKSWRIRVSDFEAWLEAKASKK